MFELQQLNVEVLDNITSGLKIQWQYVFYIALKLVLLQLFCVHMYLE